MHIRRLVSIPMAAMVALTVLVVAEPAAQATCCPMTVRQVRNAVVGMHVGPGPNTDYGKATITDTYWQNNRVYAHFNVTYGDPDPAFANASSANTTENLSVHVDTRLLSQQRYQVYSWWNPLSWNWDNIFGAIWDQWTKCSDGVVKTLAAVVTTAIVVKGFVSAMSFLRSTSAENMAMLVVGACVAAVIG